MWFVVRRVLATIPILALVTFIIFLLLYLAPGDPAVAAAGGLDARPEDIAAARERLGLDDPFLVQYLRWAGGLLVGDLGTSLFSSQSVLGAIAAGLPVTLSLTVGAVVVALVIGIPAGMFAAVRTGGLADRLVVLTTSLGIAMPSFFIGLVLVLFLALRLDWLPAIGYQPISGGIGPWLEHMILPCVTLGVAVAAELTRHMRASMRDVLAQDYVRTATAKGLSPLKVIGKHALKNAGIPVATVLGVQIRSLLGGTIVVETVFGLPGVGSLAVTSVFDRNYPMIQGIAVTAVVTVIMVNILVDLSYAYLNPRIRVL